MVSLALPIKASTAFVLCIMSSFVACFLVRDLGLGLGLEEVLGLGSG